MAPPFRLALEVPDKTSKLSTAPYKGHEADCRVKEVNEAYSTQDCSVCQARSGPKGLAGLAQRQWRCTSCGAEHDRDHNAAKNILARGLKAMEMEFAATLKGKTDEGAVNEAFGASSAIAGPA